VAKSTVGLLHPGEMGAAVGAVLRSSGARVRWASEGRSAETRSRAEAARLEDAGSTAELAVADVVFSICPPRAALEVARSLGPFEGLYVDANAVAPATAREVGEVVRAEGGRFVDGGIVGLPPREAGTTRLYLSGADAAEAAALFAGSILDARVVSEEVGDASAVKMAYAAWTKGTAAMLLAIRELAFREGVEAALLAEWGLSQPELPDRCAQAARSAEAKGWRWVGEMEEIAASFEAAGLPGGFHRAAAEVYRER
jgi:3-hydroxyisobutyrate dehydrogenase-like beta-hydroxyacid dehydrogenase